MKTSKNRKQSRVSVFNSNIKPSILVVRSITFMVLVPRSLREFLSARFYSLLHGWSSSCTAANSFNRKARLLINSWNSVRSFFQWLRTHVGEYETYTRYILAAWFSGRRNASPSACLSFQPSFLYIFDVPRGLSASNLAVRWRDKSYPAVRNFAPTFTLSRRNPRCKMDDFLTTI